MPGMDLEHCTYGWDIEGMLLTVRGNNGDEEYQYTREVPRRFRHAQVTFESLTLGNLIVSVKVKRVAMGSRSYQNSHLKRELENSNEQRSRREVTEMVASYLTALTLDTVVLDQGNDVANTDASSYLKTLSILDIGTRDGLLLQKLARNGFSQLTGTDSSDEAVKAAQQLAKCNGFPSINFLFEDNMNASVNNVSLRDWGLLEMVDDILKTNLKGQFCLINDIETLDAIGQLHDGPVKRITYWETVSRLVAPGGLVVITTFCHTRDQLVQEVEKFNQLKARTPQETKAPGETKSCNSRIFSYVDHTYPTFNSGGSAGSRVATVAFMRS
ncbi:S-adenosyl-L-methionine-dependent methyltransferases superfamily protein [Artemisia annua]|uniref:S-adenosyl-L-methionine-dependent methyltransferases superfamily protein n=1 Tax=Artemisia annua TaxID=35608 RepID=A0A2U1KW84_ARTAN|nr:S-adenosyl-L-methionine-dependent methyltransferases superfamily protein [Artemisia annua]